MSRAPLIASIIVLLASSASADVAQSRPSDATRLKASHARSADGASANNVVPLGSDFQVTPPAAGVGVPSICMLSDGGFVVVRSEGAETGGQVIGRRLDAQGKAQGSDFVVSAYTGQYARDPDVTCDASGGFAVVWTDRVPLSLENDGALDDDAFARIYESSGAAAGVPFRVNAYTAGNQNDAAVCALAGGSFAVIWQDRKRDEIDTRVVSDEGVTSDATQVAEDPRAYMRPDVACSGGKFLVVWGNFPSKAANDEVEGRVFSGDGTPAAAHFSVNSYTTGDQGYPVACGSADSGFVVAWRDARNRRGVGNIKGRRFSPSGTAVGPGFDVSPDGRDRAALVCGAESSFVVTTHATVEGAETLYAQAVDSDGELVGSEAIVNAGPTTLAERAPPAAGHGDGRFLVVWPTLASPDTESIRGRFARVGAAQTTTTTIAVTTTSAHATTTTSPGGGGECGDAVSGGGSAGEITIADALAILRAAIGAQSCEPCLCDIDGSGAITAQDALRIVSYAVGLEVELNCPPC